MADIIRTVGHSTRTAEEFISLIKGYGINALVDIRRVPFSRMCPQFNRDSLKAALRAEGIHYIPMGPELGVPAGERDLYGRYDHLDIRMVQESKGFRDGMKRLRKGLDDGFSIALMCAEKDPTKCHRFVFIAPWLERNGISVEHIIDTDTVIPHSELENSMIHSFFPDADAEKCQCHLDLFPGEDNSPQTYLADRLYSRLAASFS